MVVRREAEDINFHHTGRQIDPRRARHHPAYRQLATPCAHTLASGALKARSPSTHSETAACAPLCPAPPALWHALSSHPT